VTLARLIEERVAAERERLLNQFKTFFGEDYTS
jgi:hypothetical protein